MASQVGFNNFDSSYWYTPNASNTATKPKTQAQNNGALLPDTVEISGKKKSNTKKVVAGLGIAATIGAIIYCAATGKFSRAKQLAEHIDFKPAQTLEEAINYGKNNLGIKSYKGFTEQDLEVLNYANQGLTNISNRFKGKVRMPKKIFYENLDKVDKGTVLACVNNYTNNLVLNKNYFNKIDDFVQKEIDYITANKHILSVFREEDRELINKMFKSYKDGKLVTLKQKLSLLNITNNMLDKHDILFGKDKDAVLKFFEKFIKEKNLPSWTLPNGKPFSYEEAIKLSDKEQNYFQRMMRTLFTANPEYKLSIKKNQIESVFGTLYHEMGHLNDSSLEKLFDYKRIKKWIDNPDAKQIAEKVSQYAKTDENEFVAEVFKKLVSGKKLPDDVMKLYQELGGPRVS